MKMLKIVELKRKIKNCPQYDQEVALGPGPDATSRNNVNCTYNNNNNIIDFGGNNNRNTNR